MTLVQAISALFAQTAPAGADLQAAFNVAKGKKFEDLTDPDVNTLDAVADAFQDFTSDPAGWLKTASSTDSRYSWWVQLAQALGVTVSPAFAGGSPPPAGSTEPPPTPDPEPEQGIDPDALAGGAPPPVRREGGGGGGGVVVSGTGDDEDRSKRERERKPPEPPPPPKPLIDVTSREIPQITREILAYGSYKSWSLLIIEVFRLIRAGTPTEQEQKRAEIPHARRLIESMKISGDRLEVQSAFHLERLLEAFEAGLDQKRPSFFKAMYVTGGDYTD